MIRVLHRACLAAVVLSLVMAGRAAVAEDTIKVAYIDPFSGPFASGGDEFLKVFNVIIARQNALGGALGASSSWWRSTTSCSRPRR